MPRDLRPVFDPRSVAIIGASNDPAKWGQWLARSALRGEHRRAVYLVNRRGGEVLGRPAYASLGELPEAPELVVLAVPAESFESLVDASLAAGARAIVAIAAGLGETGPEGRAREREVAKRVRNAGAVMLGPNCLGVYDGAAELDLGTNDFVPGPLALVSQSGNLALEIALLGNDVGLGISRFASLGNQADLDAAELVAALGEHEETRAIGVYLEDFRDGRAFARACAGAGKPVLLLAGGVSAAGVEAARSHTGAFVSDSIAIDAACRAAGIVRVATPRELVDIAQLLVSRSVPGGRRVAVVTDGGGSAVVAADLAAEAGLELPRLSDALGERLAAVLPPNATIRNPVDFAGGGEQDLATYERVPRLLLESGELDAVLVTGYLGGYSATAEELREPETEAARGLARAAGETGRPAVVQTMYWQEGPAQALRAGGVPVYREIGAAVHALARVANGARRSRQVPAVPAAVAPIAAADYFSARELLAAGGIAFAPARRAETADEAVLAAAELGYPVVLKGVAALHKSDAGAVVLGIPDDEALREAAESVPPPYSVERLVTDTHSVELIVGSRWDRRIGPVLLVGIGGVFAEVLGDVSVALAPAEADEAEQLLLELRGSPLLAGTRGRPRLALDAAAEAAAALSRVAAEHPELAELEANPLLVTPHSAIALDARAVYSQPR